MERARVLSVWLALLVPGLVWAGGFGNTAPVVTSVQVSPSPVPALGTALVSCTGTDSDGTINQMRITVAGGTLPNGTNSQLLTIVRAPSVTGTIAWTTPGPGTYAITCGVADSGGTFGGALTAFLTVSVDVVAQGGGAPPEIASLVAAQVQPFVGSTTNVVATATDPDGDALTFTWSATAGSFAGDGGAVAWTAPATPGPASLTVEVRDPAGNAATATVSVEVVWGRALTPLTLGPDVRFPSRLAVDATGSYWVTDPPTRSVVLVSPFGQRLRRLALGFQPSGVAVDATGALLIADLEGGSVARYSPLGELLGALGAGPGTFQRPVDLAVAPGTGHVLVADLGARDVKAFAVDGTALGAFDLDGGSPTGIAISAGGTVVVTDGANGALVASDLAGVVQRLIGSFGGAPGNLTRGAGVTVTSAGDVFAVDGFQSRLAAFTLGGSFQAFLAPAPGELKVPSGIVADRLGRLVVANADVGRLDVFELPGARAPEIACPADLEVPAASGLCGLTIDEVTLTAKAPGQGGIVAPLPGALPPGNVFAVGLSVVGYTLSDALGASFACQQRVRVLDTQAPALACGGPVLVDAAPGQCGATVAGPLLGAGATDNCHGVAVARTTGPADGFFGVGTTQVGFTATDAVALTATCAQDVTVVDRQAPQVSCAAQTELTMAPGTCFAAPSLALVTAVALDNCTARVDALGFPGDGRFPAGTTTLTHLAVDPSGNEGSCVQQVVVRDEEAPQLACGAALTLPTDPGQCGRLIAPDGLAPEVQDNCSATVTSSVPGPSVFAVGTTPMTFEAIDPFGNRASCARAVTIEDREPPQLACPPDVFKLVLPGVCAAAVAPDALLAIATDNCAATVQTQGLPAGGLFPRGVTVLTHSAVDAAGLRASCTQRVVVASTEPVVFQCPASLTVENDRGLCGARLADAQLRATVNDGCVASVERSGVPVSGLFPVGTTSVAHVATGEGGWRQECVQTVTVQDREAPQVSCPSDVHTAAAATWCGAQLPLEAFDVGAHDNCGPVTVRRAGVPPQGRFSVGHATVTHEAEDPSGNVSRCLQAFDVVDSTPPTISCPAEVRAECRGAAGAVSVAASAVDNCGAQVSCTPVGTLPLGSTQVSCVARDPAGLEAHCGVPVTVVDEQPPALKARDVTFYTQDRDFRLEVALPLRRCGGPPTLPFELSSCVAEATDQCLGPLDPMEAGRITRVEFWSQGTARDEASAGRREQRRRTALARFDARGCERLSVSGPTARLPFDGLDAPAEEHGLYRIFYELDDGHGQRARARCEVHLLPSRADGDRLAALPPPEQPRPLDCVVCEGDGCGACPLPAQACAKPQRCAPGSGPACAADCVAEEGCAAEALACLASCQGACTPACGSCSARALSPLNPKSPGGRHSPRP